VASRFKAKKATAIQGHKSFFNGSISSHVFVPETCEELTGIFDAALL
jgi:hypothetical protein